MSTTGDFGRGLSFWLRGWAFLLQDRRLLILALLPFVIALMSTAAMVLALWLYLPEWVRMALSLWLGQVEGVWRQILYYPILFSLALVVGFSALYILYVLQTLIAIPFYALLAERTLMLVGKRPNTNSSWRAAVSKSLRVLRIGIIKAILLLVLGFVLFVFSFLPLFNLGAFALAIFLLAFDCVDYSFEVLGLGLRQRGAYLFREWPQWSGMALGLALTLIVPGLTLLVIPGAIVGAALIVKTETNPESSYAAK